jgi:hypothetical protein
VLSGMVQKDCDNNSGTEHIVSWCSLPRLFMSKTWRNSGLA